MSSILHRILQIRSNVENSRIWKAATQNVFRLVVSGVSVFAAAMAMLFSGLFLYFFMPILSIVAFAVSIVLMILVRFLADEGRRRENKK